MRRFPRLFISYLILIVIGLQSCAYYNTFYNAEQYFAEAQKLTRDNQLETASKEEIKLYSKAIEKSRKLLKRYPDSKYTDDAQFLIAKSYYFKGDYSTAQQYFSDLALNYGSSEYTPEVPIWIGRCLLKLDDLEMARHEASRIIKGQTNRALQADALLLMGEIAVKQDSLALAEAYLEQVIDRSPDGYTKAQAQFQVGKMRENQMDYQGALKAYKTVSRFKPSESLKVEAIIKQTSMLKALGQDEDAVEMIKDMLLSEKFVDVRGQLEVELGKLYITLADYDPAKTTLERVVENYSRQAVAAEASYMLGELYLTKQMNYIDAHKAYSNVKMQSSRSPFATRAGKRIKLIDQYKKVQFDHLNLQRQLSGLPPVVKEVKKSKSRSRNSRSRGRRADGLGEQAATENALNKTSGQAGTPVDTVEVNSADSLRFMSSLDENRYKLAEYMLFEFARVDTTLEILIDLENNSLNPAVKQQSAYMQYYALESIKGDQEASQRAALHIQENYPEYFQAVFGDPTQDKPVVDLAEYGFQLLADEFEKGRYTIARKGYLKLKEDANNPTLVRSKACFKYAWLNDHFLYNKTAAVEAYQELIEKYPEDPLTVTARNRLSVLTQEQLSSTPAEDSDDNTQQE